MVRQFFLIGILLACIACGKKPPTETAPIKINQIQLIGSHNSYKLPVAAGIMKQLQSENAELAAGLDYSHPPVLEQLSLGLRLLELDLYHDPEGGRFSQPLGLAFLETAALDSAKKAAFDRPGFKVFHVQDIDFNSHHPLLVDYLEELKQWSQLQPNHLPVFITVNAKDENYPERGLTEVLSFDTQAFRELDETLREVLGAENLLTPKEVMGSHPDLKAALTESGWPSLAEARGKFIWILDEKGEKMEAYLSGAEEPVFFVTAPESHPMSGIHILNDPIEQQEEIRSLVNKGYLVRTRADADTREARTNDTLRRKMAFESGAQLISTDYYLPDERFEGSYQVAFSDGVYGRYHPFLTETEKAATELPEAPASEVVVLDAQTFQFGRTHGSPLVLDVRTQAEVDEGIIPGAVHIDFMQADFADKAKKLKKEDPVFIYCKVGGRSARAAELMRGMGFEKVYHLEGGIDGWTAAGFPVVR
ncbi:Ca2+-dependent phosphoinositide-specific phospholipase C [Cyclobacterium xiamenense]|uniref:Ca2+-dependent phosphoinositide-specific phospholipase C n=1 Tax=Cyclobacterium xiamenense TaxID=1297121 RepID=UPI0035D12080